MSRIPTVVLADDHADFLEEVQKLLAQDFQIVGKAHDGISALGATREQQPDLAILDIEMPGLSGIQVTRAIRESGLGTKIILLTMHQDEDYMHSGLEAGAQGFVFKYLMRSDLRHAIEEVLSGRTFVSGHDTRPRSSK